MPSVNTTSVIIVKILFYLFLYMCIQCILFFLKWNTYWLLCSLFAYCTMSVTFHSTGKSKWIEFKLNCLVSRSSWTCIVPRSNHIPLCHSVSLSIDLIKIFLIFFSLCLFCINVHCVHKIKVTNQITLHFSTPNTQHTSKYTFKIHNQNHQCHENWTFRSKHHNKPLKPYSLKKTQKTYFRLYFLH